MLFILIRVLPFLLPVLYFVLTESVLYFGLSWYLVFMLILALDIVYFSLILLRIKNKQSLFFLFHSLIFLIVGFAYFLILSSQVFINVFNIVWSIIYFIYLEAIFHHLYNTTKVTVMSLKNVIAYINLILFFFLAATLFNLYVFLGLSWSSIILISLLVSFVLFLSRFNVSEVDVKKSLLYSIFLSLMIMEIVAAGLFLSVSFFVSAIIVSVFYYVFSSLSVLHMRGDLTKTTIMQYIAFTVIVLLMVSLTAQWL